MELVPLLRDFGFPVALACYLLIRGERERKECQQRHDALQRQIDELRGIPPHSDEGYPKLYRPEGE